MTGGHQRVFGAALPTAMKYVLDQAKLRPAILKSVQGLSGQDVRECYQCGKCSAGCPIAADMDLPPNQVMRLLQLGVTDEVLRSRTIWLCASCETCTTRCPREVDLAAVMDALRNIALQQGVRTAERPVTFFNRTFLRLIRKYGRVFEMELIGRYNVGTFNFFKDVTKAPKLLLKGRLKFFPSLKGRKTAVAVFKDVKKLDSTRAEASSGQSGTTTEQTGRNHGR
jgi:heterodisulfide reductase subunit C